MAGWKSSATWSIYLRASGKDLAGRVVDEKGTEMGKVEGKDGTFGSGGAGLTATTFAAFADFSIAVPMGKTLLTQKEIDEQNAAAAKARQTLDYPIVRPVEASASLNTPFAQIRDSYDVVIAGAGTGGLCAALEAARLGASVLLVEETDYIGGQMANAGVGSMDEGGIWGKMPVRERGIYREFHESLINHYYTLNKDPYTAYHFNPQAKTGPEPYVARAIFYGLIEETAIGSWQKGANLRSTS